MGHRGPDEAGIHATDDAVVAHQRLSIIDVAGGHQPFISDDGRLALVCNGEIYNHLRLRNGLAARHRFQTGSDCEVILHLYEDVGPSVRRAARRHVRLRAHRRGARVRGARSARHQAALLRAGRRRRSLVRLGDEGLPETCVEVHEFPAGSRYTAEGGFERWWHPTWAAPGADRRPSVPDLIAPTLEASVEKRLMSDVPLGVFLSGGLDSSLIAAITRRHVDGCTASRSESRARPTWLRPAWSRNTSGRGTTSSSTAPRTWSRRSRR